MRVSVMCHNGYSQSFTNLEFIKLYLFINVSKSIVYNYT